MIIALILFLIASLIFTFPLLLNLNNIISNYGVGDGYLYIWNAYIFWHELLSGNNPFMTKMVLYPIGVNLAFHDYSPLTNLFLGIFKSNLVVGMNVMILLAFTMASFSTFLLIKLITKNYLLSIIAGLIYGFSPIMFSYLSVEHYYYLFAAPYLPLGILFTLQFWQKKKLVYFLAVILMFWLVFFTSYYMAMVYIITTTTIFLTKGLILIIKNRNLPLLIKFKSPLTLLVLFILLPMLFLFLFVFNIGDFKKYRVTESLSINTCNADLAGYLIPNQNVSYLQNISLQLANRLGYKPRVDTQSYYLGLLYLALAIIAVIKFRKNSDIVSVGIAGLLILLLSSGTRIQIGSLTILEGTLSPFYWFSKLPFMSFIGCPIRFPIVVLLSVLFLSFFLINKLIDKYKLSNILICSLLLVLFFLEFGIPKIHLASTKAPKVYDIVAQTNDNSTVLELPSGLTEGYGRFGFDYSISGLHGMQMYWQTVYQKPRIGGYFSRIPKTAYQFFQGEPIISDIFKMTDYDSLPINKKFSQEEVEKFIKKFNIRYIVFSPNGRQNEYLVTMEKLLQNLQYKKIYDEGFVLLNLY